VTEPAVTTTSWRTAIVRQVTRVGQHLVMLRLELPETAPSVQQLPGQHFVVRLTAPDGYTASRSYSVSSSPGEALIELCVERLDDGEVSGYLYDIVQPGDEIEVRGPIGGWFVWDGQTPAVAIGGGTGVVPLVAMARYADELGTPELLRLAVSGRSAADLPYYDELLGRGATVALTALTGRRLGATDLEPLLDGTDVAFICGSARFAESMSQLLVSLNYPASAIRIERFGPS
jgi:ferredoxin-NADP reductase